ncbi:MSMEG_1061 family FMN-dependent PPOX-type flavoprotein [Ilumatobacter sp.]|uniref:MSMEG_1061 family FMN-dependent PPOX-type flavoprotein n=1 Tax=Ilumatobacter sp. TaxID=1967498 RepID=UPI003B52C29F
MSDSAPVSTVISEVAGLRSVYRDPAPLVLDKAIPVVDEAAAGFIAASPLVVLATGDGTRSDASPRGGEPGFVKVVDSRHLAFGDMAGNNRLDSFSNLMTNPTMGMLFIVPGVTETLRVRGTAIVARDSELAEFCAIGGRTPKTVIIVDVEECYLHCGAAFKRAGAWDPETWPTGDDRPSSGAILAAHAKLDVDGDVVQADLDAYYDDVQHAFAGDSESESG